LAGLAGPGDVLGVLAFVASSSAELSFRATGAAGGGGAVPPVCGCIAVLVALVEGSGPHPKIVTTSVEQSIAQVFISILPVRCSGAD
jgi:hypothetical protein